jgi:hypothetical protein
MAIALSFVLPHEWNIPKYAVKDFVFQRELVPPGNWVAPAGSNRSGCGGNEAAGVFDGKDRVSDSASKRAVTQVNTEQASKVQSRKPTRFWNEEGRRRWGTRPLALSAEGTSDKNPRFRRGTGDGTFAQEHKGTREAPTVAASDR